MLSINAFNEQGGTSVTPQYASPFLPRSIHHNSKLMFCHIPSPPQLPIEQNRCAMACQGCGAVLFLLKSSGITFHNPLLLSYHTKQLN